MGDTTRCRDSSLYGHVQTIWQDLILDLLQCSDFRGFCTFCIFCIFAFSHISHFRIPHAFCDLTHFAFHVLTYLAHFMFSHSRVFCALTRATTCLPRIHPILFACPVLILQGPLVCISLCFTRITSYMSLHSHLCSLILLCVYITSPLYV
jgi:hypothetical protein